MGLWAHNARPYDQAYKFLVGRVACVLIPA